MKKRFLPDINILISMTFCLVLFSYVYADDVSPPIITISGVSEGSYYSTAVYPQILIEDTDLNYSTVELNGSAYISGTEIKSDKAYRLFVSAFDSAGNASYESVNFVIDKTKPAITITGVKDNSYYTTDVWFKVKIAETNSAKKLITLDGNTCPENETVWVRDESGHKLIVDTLDKAGNANLKTYTFTIDKTNPLISISNVNNGESYNQAVLPEVEVYEINPETTSVTLNGISWETGNVIAEEGKYELSVFSRDKAGNQSYDSVNFDIKFPKSSLEITGGPDSAFVYLDGDYVSRGKLMGKIENGAFSISNITAGKHFLRIAYPGYIDYLELIDFTEGLFEKEIVLNAVKEEKYSYGRLILNDTTSLRPWVVDYNQDGKKDLVARTSDDKDYLYLNIGTDASPEFEPNSRLQTSDVRLFEVYYESTKVEGKSDGTIYFNDEPLLINDSTFDVGGHSWPFVFDFDHDGKDDLISGAQNGKIYFFKNTGDGLIFASGIIIQVDGKDLDVGSYSRPFVIDWNDDGRYDLLVGSSKGLYLYQADTPPDAVSIIPAEGKYKDPIILSAEVSDSDVYDTVFDLEIQYRMSGDTAWFAGYQSPEQQSPVNISWNSGLNGIVNLRARAFDGLLWSDWLLCEGNIQIDNIPPVTVSDAPINWINSGVDVELKTLDDFDSGCVTYYSLNGNQWTNGKVVTVNQSGINILTYYSIDDVGNKENEKYSTVKIDKDPPVIINLLVPDINEKSNGINITCDIKDNLSGLDTTLLQYNIDNQWIDFINPLNLDWDSLTGRIIQFKVYARDNLGNWKYSEEIQKTVEDVNDPPVIVSYSPAYESVNIKEAEKLDFSIEVYDPEGKEVKYNWYIDSTLAGEAKDYLYFPDYGASGYHKITVYVYDSDFVIGKDWSVEVEDVSVGKPLSLEAETGVSGSIVLNWEANTDFSLLGYNVYRDGIKINNSIIIENYFQDSGLVDSTKYVYFIKAQDIEGRESDNSDSVEVIPGDLAPPGKPKSLRVSKKGLLYWQSPPETDVTGYYLYCYTTEDLNNKMDIGLRRRYQLKSLLPETAYYFAVSAYDCYCKESEKSNTTSFMFYDSAVPGQPNGVRVRRTAENGELEITWRENAELDIAGYKIFYGKEPLKYTGEDANEGKSPIVVNGSTKFVLTGLKDSIKYYISISAFDFSGNESEKSWEVIGTPKHYLTNIEKPDNLILKPADKTVKLSWDKVNGADGYKIYFGNYENLPGLPLITHETAAIFSNLRNDTTYFVALSSFTVDKESEKVYGSVCPKDNIPPGVPSDLTCIPGNDGTSLILSWSLNKETDLSQYKISYKTAFTHFKSSITIDKTNKYLLTGLTEGERYFIALFARDESNNTGNPAIINAETRRNDISNLKGSPPAPFLNIDYNYGIIDLSWSKPDENIDNYRIYRRIYGNDKYIKIAETDRLTFQDKDILPDKTYYYMVTSIDKDSLPEEGMFSNETGIKTHILPGDIELEEYVPVRNRVDGYDLITLSISFGAKIGDENYNPNADLNDDGVIDGVDLGILAENYGKSY